MSRRRTSRHPINPSQPPSTSFFYLKFTQRTPVCKHHGVFDEEEEVQVPRPFHSRRTDGCAVYQRDALLQSPAFGRGRLCHMFIKVGETFVSSVVIEHIGSFPATTRYLTVLD